MKPGFEPCFGQAVAERPRDYPIDSDVPSTSSSPMLTFVSETLGAASEAAPIMAMMIIGANGEKEDHYKASFFVRAVLIELSCGTAPKAKPQGRSGRANALASGGTSS